MIDALDIRVRGIVQGVGFRPFVYRLARRYIVNGWVLNDLDGVFIHAEGEGKLLDEFVTELHMNPPAAAVVREVELKEVPLQDCTTFEIRESRSDDVSDVTLVSADLGICDDCLRELFDPADRRYRYPFINCTNCGPRFTIIDALPYDRPATSMAGFAMCDDCAREYADPSDRRFHAQPDACFACGPHLTWTPLSTGLADGECSEEILRLGPSALAQDDRGARPAPGTRDAGEAASPSVILSGAGEAGAVEGSPQGTRAARSSVPAPSPSTPPSPRDESDAALAATLTCLSAGGIVAVKGLGGFHLACDASNAEALATLRARKHRDGKAFAVMVADVADARAYCRVSDEEAALLASAARPIVLLRKRPDVALAPGLADALPELGVMLPATPVQALLIHDFKEATGRDMLVMTSGNMHDEPIVVDDDEALSRLAGIADAVLGNNRAILARYDDSVVRVLDLGGRDAHGDANLAIQIIRRARGYAPVPLALNPTRRGSGQTGQGSQDASNTPPATAPSAPTPAHEPAIFAAGSEQKSTFTFVRDGDAYVSQHIGDVEDADVYDAWLESKARFERLFDLEATSLACDAHPEYLASKWVREQAQRTGTPLVEVQHHHAHIASVLGEHGIDGPVLGIAFDGTGFGADGAIWGGEALLVNQMDYERFANFSYMPMPGGAAAVKHPLRMAYGMLWAFDLLDHPGAAGVLSALGDAAGVCERMVEGGLNTPHTSSVGRLFDGVSAMLGVCTEASYEGEPAILLDAVRAESPLAEGGDCGQRYAVAITKNAATAESTAHDTSVVLLDAAPTVRAVLDDVVAGVSAGEISRRFHDAVVGAIVQVAELVRAMYDIDVVALSGGCFMNRYLVEQATARLGAAGFTVALNAALPPNDGCVSFGQAVVANARRQAAG